MHIAFNIAKNLANIAKHGTPLTVAFGFRMAGALIREDDRYNYGEARYQALGYVGDRLHMLVFTRRGDVVRVISIRKANKRERKLYDDRT